MNTGKQMIALFIVIGACLGIAAFVLVLTSKQNCQAKEPFGTRDMNKSPLVDAKEPLPVNMLGVKMLGDGEAAAGGGMAFLNSAEAPAEEATRQQILVRQRGIKMFPGEGVGMGEDHTLFATAADGKVQKGMKILSA